MTNKREQAYEILDKLDGDITDKELAEKVGYSNRSGAYKARQKWQEMNKDDSKTDNSNTVDKSNSSPKNSDTKSNESSMETSETETEKKQDGNKETNGNNEETQGNMEKGSGNNNDNPTPNTDETPKTDDNSKTENKGKDINVSHTESKKKGHGSAQSIVDNPTGIEIETTGNSNDDNKSDENNDIELTENNKEFKNKLEENTDGGNIEIDDEVLGYLIGMPFKLQGTRSGYPELWELSEEEKETNAKLLKQYADKKGIDISVEVALLTSLGGQFGGRMTMQKQREKKDNNESKAIDNADSHPNNSQQNSNNKNVDNQNENNENEEPDRLDQQEETTNEEPDIFDPETW